MNLLLKNCRVIITQNNNRDVLKNYDVLVENGKIIRIEKNINVSNKDYEVIDCKNKVLMPGLINSHTHAAMTLLRGYRDDLPLDEWLNEVWKVEAKLNGRYVKIGTLMACLEMIKTGTVCFVDMYFFMDAAMEAVKESGMRAFLGYGMIDLFNEEKREREIKETIRFVETVLEENNERIKPVISPHAIYTCSEDLLVKSKELSEKYNLKLTIHLSETRKEVHWCIKEYNLRPVDYLEKINLLNENLITFHTSWLTKEEIKKIGKHKVSAVHCPTSNMKLATGGAFPYREMLENNILVSLGTDGACSNNSLDIFREMKFAALLQKWFRWNAKEMIAQQALDLATINPAKMLNLNIGSIEVGKDADIILLDINNYRLLPLKNIISNIVYSAIGDCVTDVMVKGKFLMKDKMLLTLDEEKVKEEFSKAVKELIG
jgi:5-methylthioadenosine/S-adenosylhomocysteine deaminase